MVAPGGHAWLLGGVYMVLFGVACVVLFGGCVCFFSFFGYNEIRSMSGWYASYWNAFLLTVLTVRHTYTKNGNIHIGVL